VVVDPERLERNPVPPPVHVERVLADGLTLVGRELRAGPVTLPPGRGAFEFHYTALSLADPKKVRFKYRLVGYDEDWIDAGSRRSAYYTNMPPGSYHFRVIASNDDGVWNQVGDTVELRLRPAFYQSWIFYLACGVGGALLLRGLHHLRIHALVRRNQELREMQRQLEAKSAEMERFTYAVSHDLKSPLVTVLGYLGFLEKDLAGGNPERTAADIERIRGAANKMRQLLDELLELSRIGGVVQSPEAVELAVVAREAVELNAGRIAERGVEVVVAPDLPVVTGDRRRLLQMLQNLVDNAVKFMGDQERPRIEIGSTGIRDGKVGKEATCFVRDNGAGIDAEYHQRIFGVFNRLDPEIEGVGMGLALVGRIVEVHGGRIWVESEGPGRGSTFYFTLPATDR
jgi:signal transduction histidine kinase